MQSQYSYLLCTRWDPTSSSRARASAWKTPSLGMLGVLPVEYTTHFGLLVGLLIWPLGGVVSMLEGDEMHSDIDRRRLMS